MNKIVLLVVSVLFCSCVEHTNYPLSIKVTVAKEYKEKMFHRKLTKLHPIKITILNKSNKKQEFCLMTCSWYANFISSSSMNELKSEECDANWVEVKSINPNDSMVISGEYILGSRLFNYQKLGFIFVPPTQFKTYILDKDIMIHDYTKFMEYCEAKNENIIWSDYFRVP